jgi:hypothetical protein
MLNGRYEADLTDAAWELVKPLLPAPRHGGRARTTDVRAVVNAIFYLECCRNPGVKLLSALPARDRSGRAGKRVALRWVGPADLSRARVTHLVGRGRHRLRIAFSRRRSVRICERNEAGAIQKIAEAFRVFGEVEYNVAN